MAAFADLNITNTGDTKKLKSIIETAAHLGYSTVAINRVIDLQPKKQEIPKAICVSELFHKFPIVQGTSKPIRVLTRLTVMVSEASHFRIAAEYKSYDLLAIYPKTEKSFHAACMNFDVDIICIAVTEKQPFYFKRPPVFGAIERGIFFEISYTGTIRDSTMRRYTLANAFALVETCKGKNVVVSSGAEMALDLRGPYDIANLGLLFGLSEGDAKAAVSANCRAALLHGETRKTALGIIHTVKNTQPDSGKQQRQQQQEEENKDAPATKKAKLEAV